MARDVPDHEQQVTAWELEGVVPVTRHQGARPGRKAAPRDVDAGGGQQADTRRHDRALQPQRELVFLRGPLLTVGQQVPGFCELDPGLVEETERLDGGDGRLRPGDLRHRNARLWPVVTAAGGHRHTSSGTLAATRRDISSTLPSRLEIPSANG